MNEELKQSQERLRDLQGNFNEVSQGFIDVLILEILTEEARFNALLKEARNGKPCKVFTYLEKK